MTPTAEDFDGWYADLADSPRRAEIQQGALGLPPHIESTSLLPWSGVADVLTALELSGGDTLVDLACGRGGYGLELARRSGARLVGIDFSAVAVARAGELASGAFAGVDARFEVGELTATGLPDGSASALMCVDAMQFADPYEAGFAECLRVLAPGGRLAVTGWQPRDPDDTAMPARLRNDIAAAAVAAGFDDVRAQHMPVWQSLERTMWERAMSVDPAGDAAVQQLRDEGGRVLTWLERSYRMFVTARRPGRP